VTLGNDNGTDGQTDRRPPQYALSPGTMAFDRLTLKLVSALCVTWAIYVPISVFQGPPFSI